MGNTGKHATVVTVAIKDKMDLGIGIACEWILQIAMLVLSSSSFLAGLPAMMTCPYGSTDIKWWCSSFRLCS